MRRTCVRAGSMVGLLFLMLVSFAAAAQAAARAPAARSPLQAQLRIVGDLEASRDTTSLAAFLRGGSPRVREAAARALGRIQERASAGVLVKALADPVASVRREAAFALGLAGDSSAAPALATRLETERDATTRQRILTALGMLGARRSGPAIARSLRAKSAAERDAAALAAAASRDSSLVDALILAAREKREEIRWRAAYALGRIGDVRGAMALRGLTRDRFEIVRYHAAGALGGVRDSSAAPRLVALLYDEAWRVRVQAIRALGTVGAVRDAPSIRALLKDPHPHVRWEAALALGSLRDSSSVDALTAALEDSATGVVQGAALSLLRVQGESALLAIAPALDQLPGFLRSGLIEALGSVEGPGALELLLAHARPENDPALTAGAASALGKRTADAPLAVPALRALLGAEEFTVVASAADALGALSDTASVDTLATLLRRRGTPADADIRASAAGAIAAIKTSGALEALAPLRADPERRIREIVVRALGLPPDSVGADPRPELRIDPIPDRSARVAVVETERGAIRIALDAVTAPRTVANFARLAREGYFDRTAFHRVVPNFVIQDGCPRGDGWGGPGYAIPCELSPEPYRVGTVGMALAGKDTGGSQWFVTLSPQPRLEGRYSVFGTVTEGMEVVERIMPGDRILRVSVH